MARKAAKTAVKASGTKKKTGAAGGKKTGSGGSRKAGNKTASSAGRKKSTGTSSSGRRTASGAAAQRMELEEEMRRQETVRDVCLVILFCATVFLMLSMFGVTGPAGDIFSEIMFGLFGLTSYILPLFVFFTAAAAVIRGKDRFGTPEVLSFCGIMLAVTMICGLLEQDLYTSKNYSAEEIFKFCRDMKRGGGVIGGSLDWLLYHAVRVPGTVIAVIMLIAVCLVVLTDHSYVNALRRYGKRHKERAGQKKLVRQAVKEERERRRMESLEREEAEEEDDGFVFLDPAEEDNPADPGRLDRMVIGPEKTGADRGKKADGRKKADPVYTQRDDRHGIVIEDFDEIPFDEEEPSAVRPEETSGSRGFRKGETFESYRRRSAGRARPAGEQARDISGVKVTEKDTDLFRESPDGSFEGPDSLPGQSGMSPASDEDRMEPPAGTDSMGEEGRRLSEPGGFEKVTDRRARQAVTVPADNPEDGPADVWDAAADGTETVEKRAAYIRTVLPSASKEDLDGIEVHRAETGKNTGVRTKKPARSGSYILPPMDILNQPDRSRNPESDRTLQETAYRLQESLRSFNVGVTITDIDRGPVVTRYELQPDVGVKVSSIVSRENDIKLALAATNIRIEAPIPGKSAVGIEVPNRHKETVTIRELLESREFAGSKSRLTLALGKDLGGQNVISDLSKMPHLLIAGTTGSGKSVCINTIIISILYKAGPEEVQFLMIDPKQVELSVYNGIPHLLHPVVTDPRKAAVTLNWAIKQMNDRYKKFSDANVRDIRGYNQLALQYAKEGEETDITYMPRLVIVVDELADLMMVAKNDVEAAIIRLAQLARAAGIHLILATQRPSVNVITGLIKANMPNRIAFAVSSQVDSRTIIDGAGAEKLLGEGDMLFYPQNYQKPVRVQGAFVSDDEVSRVVEAVKSRNAAAASTAGVEEQIDQMTVTGLSQAAGSAENGTADGRDEYFPEAGRFIIEKKRAAIGMLQRRFRIGFNRAARIMDQLCEAGVVGPESGTKPREILMTLAEFENMLANGG